MRILRTFSSREIPPKPLASCSAQRQWAVSRKGGLPTAIGWETSALAARLERGATVEVGQRAAQAEFFQDQLFFQFGQAALGPNIAAAFSRVHVTAILPDN